ncbi:MAG: DNA polymerase III [Gallionellales bacterium RIFCSPHIGHO2_02_FULL_57_16]|nr:MAG: DNA polymerase III [Gallionellales bacterium RIFCSPHIGHO2_02_FULL_57_16]
MDRNEAVLRELNLYPQWVRRNQPAPVAAQEPMVVTGASRLGGGEADTDTQQSAMGIATLNPSYGDCPEPAEEVGLKPDLRLSSASGGDLSNLGWPQLKAMVRDCTACKLRAGCTQTVFGVGDENADWLFVGEGPGADEDAQGEPFVGQAGKLLDNMLLAIKLRRGKDVYIANIVKCRPPGNRNPDAEEIAACMPYLRRQIELIKPKLIVALGKVASNALLGKEATLASLRGTLHDFQGIPLIVTYHPAYLLRSPAEKAKTWQDLCFAVQEMQKL